MENVKLAPFSSGGEIALTSLTPVSITFASRAAAPYPPGNFRIGTLAWGVRPAHIAGDLVLSWVQRNRLTQTSVVAQDAAEVPGEAGQSATLRISVGGVLKHTFTGLGDGFTYTAAQRGIDDADYTKTVHIELRSHANGLDSYYAQTYDLIMFGPATSLPSPGRYEFPATEVGGLAL